MALRQRKKTKKYIQKVKSFAKCSNCKTNDDHCLEFHHINDKKFTIANAMRLGMSISSVKKETKKCIILCSNCHRELHFLEQNKEYNNLNLKEIFKKELEKLEIISNLKKCKYCKKEFKGTLTKRLYCSSECQEKNTKIRKKKEYLENYRNNPPKNKTKKQLLKEKSIRKKDLKNLIKKYIMQFKLKNGCSKCGEKRWFCLDFHHKKDKLKNVSSMLSQAYSLQSVKKEMTKCDLLCANCHKKEHYEND